MSRIIPRAYVTAAAILQGIKDEKIKALLIGQMKAARELGM